MMNTGLDPGPGMGFLTRSSQALFAKSVMPWAGLRAEALAPPPSKEHEDRAGKRANKLPIRDRRLDGITRALGRTAL